MKITRLYELPENIKERAMKDLGGEYNLVIGDIARGASELYMFGNSLTCLYCLGETVQVVFLYGENLKEFSDFLIKTLRGVGIKELVIHTKRKGMAEHMKSLGGLHTGTYEVYRLEL